MPDTYVLFFDASGQNPTNINIPKGKALYLSRAPQVSAGTATVQDVLTGKNYVLANQVTLCAPSGVGDDKNVSLAFRARSKENITQVLAEVISPRSDIPSCG